MNLLLDALKKSGESRLAQSGNETRSATPPVKNRHRPAHLPVALIAGGIFAVGSGYYYQITSSPPEQHTTATTAPPDYSHTPVVLQSAAAATQPAHAPGIPDSGDTPIAHVKILPPRIAAMTTVQPEKPSHAVATPDAPSDHLELPADKTLSVQHTTQPDSIDPILMAAYQAYKKGDYADAWERYREALAKEPQNRDALLSAAVVAQAKGDDDVAIAYFRQVLMLDPRDPIAQAGLASFGSDPVGKESRLKQLIEQQPEAAVLYFALGHRYAEQSRWTDAQQAYFSALTMEPRNTLFAFHLAVSLDHMGQRKAAAKYYQQAIQLNPSDNTGFSREQALQRLNELTATGK